MSDADQPGQGSSPSDRNPGEGGRDEVDAADTGDRPDVEGGLISNTGDDGGAPSS